jgi:hypothetical protein
MAAPIDNAVACRIGGKTHSLRWSKRALCILGRDEYSDATGDIDQANGAALFRRLCVFTFAMLRGNHRFSTPEDLAEAITDEETEPLMEAVNKAILAGSKKEADPDPLSANGPSPDTASG